MSLRGESMMEFQDGTQAPFDLEPRLTQISQAVMPKGMIADEVLHKVPVDGVVFAYATDKTEEAYTIPETEIGRSSPANQVEFGADDATDKILDYGLESPVPRRDQMAARSHGVVRDPIARATENVANLVKLARERRVARLVTNLNSYDPTLRETVASANDRWDSAMSDPVREVLEASDRLLMPPNTLVMGQEVWTKLSQHPRVVEGTEHSGAGADKAAGVARMQAVAELLKVERILVGRTKYNSARRGLAPQYDFLWGKHAALLYLDETIQTPDEGKATWGFTATWMEMEGVYVYFDEKRCSFGSDVVRNVMPCKELISFMRLGYLWRNVVS